ncbi:hypothetical protein ACFLXY_00510 [Chloroflexota bacterium]
MKRMLLITGLMVIMLPLITGCPGLAIDGRPPEYSVCNPSMLPDGSGGVIVAYQVNRGNSGSIYLQRLGADGNFLWDESGIELSTTQWGFLSGNIECVSLVSDDKGNFIAVYPSIDGLKVRKLTMEGDSIWPNDEVRVFTGITSLGDFKAAGDSSGGVVIARSTQDSIELQRIDGDGDLLWNTNIPVEVDRFDIVVDAIGNTFVIWKDNPSYSEGDIFVQMVDTDGTIAWLTGGVQLTDEENPGFRRGSFDHRIISDGNGGVLCTWSEVIHSEDGRHITGQRLYAQRISRKGEILWESGGVLITGTEWLEEPCIIESDPGSILVVWEDIHRIYKQKLDLFGNMTWPGDSLEIMRIDEIMYYSVTSDGSGGAVLVWNYTDRKKRYVGAQHMNTDGSNLWGDGGIKVSTVSPYWAEYSVPARILPDGTGGFVISWASGKNIKDSTSSYIQRVSAEGELLWGEDGIKLGP